MCILHSGFGALSSLLHRVGLFWRQAREAHALPGPVGAGGSAAAPAVPALGDGPDAAAAGAGGHAARAGNLRATEKGNDRLHVCGFLATRLKKNQI